MRDRSLRVLDLSRKLISRKGSLKLTIFLFNQRQNARCKVISEAAQGFCEFISVYGSRAILVEMLEYVLPIADIFPQAGELCGRSSIGI